MDEPASPDEAEACRHGCTAAAVVALSSAVAAGLWLLQGRLVAEDPRVMLLIGAAVAAVVGCSRAGHPVLLGAAAMVGFPVTSLVDFALHGGHTLLPFELIFYFAYALFGAAVAGVVRVLVSVTCFPFRPRLEVLFGPGGTALDVVPPRPPDDGPDQLGRTELHYAARDGDAELVAVRLAAGDDPRLADAHGWTPLHFAAEAGAAEVVHLLIAGGAQVDAKDLRGNTPLWRAVFAYHGDGSVIRVLREAGGDPHQPNHQGVTPMGLARTSANHEVRRCFAR